jgi:hypothetical protein
MKHNFHYIDQKFCNIVGLKKSHIGQYFLVFPKIPPNFPKKVPDIHPQLGLFFLSILWYWKIGEIFLKK